MVLHFVKPGSTSVYEGLMERLRAALQMSENTGIDRQAQAAGWRVYRANMDISGQGNTMYAWVIDPVVSGADYAASTILTEAFPSEAELLRQAYDGSLTDAPLQQLPVRLSLIEAQPTTSTSDRATLLLHFIKRGADEAYENAVQRLGQAWQENGIEERHLDVEAFGWKVFRAIDNITGRDDAMYVWITDPAIERPGESVSKIFTDLIPVDDLHEISETFSDSLADVEWNDVPIDFRLVTAF